MSKQAQWWIYRATEGEWRVCKRISVLWWPVSEFRSGAEAIAAFAAGGR